MFSKRSIYIILILVISIALYEAAVSTAWIFPTIRRTFPFNRIAIYFYNKNYKNIIQFEPEDSRYDPELTYTLRPGTFWFSNPEFKTEFRVNSAGIRDDEDSLIKPDVIVLGDSMAMGWGVDQNETYSEIIERKTGLKVLNAAVSSYGTVREMFMLKRLDTSNLKHMVVYYMANDYLENKFFYEHKNYLKISSKDTYDKRVNGYLEGKKYYPGKYTIGTLSHGFFKLKCKIFNIPSSPRDETNYEAKYFINALINASSVDLREVQIIVLSSEESSFIKALEEEIRNNDYPLYIKNIIPIAMGSKLDKASYFSLDDHLNRNGHSIIAQEIIKIIGTNRQ